MKNIKTVMLALTAAITFLPNAALTDTTRRFPSKDGFKTAGPYYDSVSKSYFEYRRGPQLNWRKTNNIVKGLVYKGRQGRLAIIRTAETHSFLVKHFKINVATFIGMRLFCKERSLRWVDGSNPSEDNFSAWASRLQGSYVCRDPRSSYPGEYRSIFLPTGSFNWQITGQQKAYFGYLVEFPAPAETDPATPPPPE